MRIYVIFAEIYYFAFCALSSCVYISRYASAIIKVISAPFRARITISRISDAFSGSIFMPSSRESSPLFAGELSLAFSSAAGDGSGADSVICGVLPA